MMDTPAVSITERKRGLGGQNRIRLLGLAFSLGFAVIGLQLVRLTDRKSVV